VVPEVFSVVGDWATFGGAVAAIAALMFDRDRIEKVAAFGFAGGAAVGLIVVLVQQLGFFT
jgi:hypothetical protein